MTTTRNAPAPNAAAPTASPEPYRQPASPPTRQPLRRPGPLDQWLGHAQTRLQEMTTAAAPPAPGISARDRRRIAGMMRVNHAGEIAAQGLYQGQAAFARHADNRDHLLHAAEEERAHLQLCAERLQEVGSAPSLLGPVWYAGSYLMGAGVAHLGDRVSLGFVAETERQVEQHLDSHLQQLPPADTRSRAIIERMKADEAAHGAAARARGGVDLPPPVRRLMRWTARVMTGSAYWI